MLTMSEFEAIMADPSKEIREDLVWKPIAHLRRAARFRTPVRSTEGYPLSVVGRFNADAGKLSYTLVHGVSGRIYALDLGTGHRNPDGRRVGRKHKHSWSEEFRDQRAYVPDDITEDWEKPVAVWHQFCVEARLFHSGIMKDPILQLELPL